MSGHGRACLAIVWVGTMALITSAFAAPPVHAAARAAADAATTGRANSITPSSALLVGTVKPSGKAKYYFLFGTTRTYGQRTASKPISARRGNIRARVQLRGLAPRTTYHYRLVVVGCRRCRQIKGSDRAFTTAPPPPTVTVGAPSSVVQTTATLTGTVNPQGAATSYYIEYGGTPVYGFQSRTKRAGAGTAAIAVALTLIRLHAVSTYHFRIVATNRTGTSYGPDETFTTTGYYTNPAFSATAFPDPFVLDVGGTHSDYWAFATGDRFPLLHSTDLINWVPSGVALGVRPAWVVPTGDWHPWAPSVLPTPTACPGASAPGCFVMYYVGLSATYGANCIAVATSPTPGGPYTDQGPLDLPTPGQNIGPNGTPIPLGCGDSAGKGNIDPSPLVAASGQPYLYVSTDRMCSAGTCTPAPTLSAIPLTGDLMHAGGVRVPLVAGVPGSWEANGVPAPNVEGPFVEQHNGLYYLFYSGGSFQTAYGMGYAMSTSPTGPFTEAAGNPIFTDTASAFSPGGADTFVTGPHGGQWMVYAARLGSYAANRTLWIDPVVWQPSPGAPDVPVLAGPSSTPQPYQP
jgi:Glycosyl hydrolases family 43